MSSREGRPRSHQKQVAFALQWLFLADIAPIRQAPARFFFIRFAGFGFFCPNQRPHPGTCHHLSSAPFRSFPPLVLSAFYLSLPHLHHAPRQHFSSSKALSSHTFALWWKQHSTLPYNAKVKSRLYLARVSAESHGSLEIFHVPLEFVPAKVPNGCLPAPVTHPFGLPPTISQVPGSPRKK